MQIYIDSCAWNFLFRFGIDLWSELPPDRYQLHMTREVEIEVEAIPETGKDGADNRPLKQYIAASIARSKVSTTGTFGFQTYELDGTPSKVQVNVGFGQGTFQSDQERAYYASPEIKAQILGKPKRGSGLSANQADASLAVHANNAIILTDESPDKAGPLKLAYGKGAKIVYLNAQFASSGLSLGAFVASVV
ncbi:MAG: hypothetical protein PHF20_02890 [Halothiobacillaceae bacterium]|nr:hypothetical protein [Halothiobacillaceae bacterium]